ncbi:MAG: electron transfer flavoprotein subunit alpha/FixB family protein, partial [Betaproteobacteria bacterium]|nr:electron transfer flavoprotein subunit alpha/FixB family protein [Betaproteobacteria bacterium]
MAVLVIAEHDNRRLKPGVTNTIAAATKLGADVNVLVCGHQCGDAAAAVAKVAGVAKVLVADTPHYAVPLAENLAALVVSIADKFTHILAPATGFGKNFMPRVAAQLDVAQVSDISGIESPDTFVRPIYAGNALATVQSKDRIKVVTVRITAFDAAGDAAAAAPVENISPLADSGLSQFKGHDLTKSSRPELAAARIIVSGGRGMGSAENFKLLEALADKLGAAVGASRAAVDSGFVPNDCQVGQTGKIVAPELYIAVGISGAIQH